MDRDDELIKLERDLLNCGQANSELIYLLINLTPPQAKPPPKPLNSQHIFASPAKHDPTTLKMQLQVIFCSRLQRTHIFFPAAALNTEGWERDVKEEYLT